MPKQARWHECLSEFDFQFLYNSESSNKMVDALIRKLEVATLMHIAQLSRSITETTLKGRIREELLNDPQVMALKKLISMGKLGNFG